MGSLSLPLVAVLLTGYAVQRITCVPCAGEWTQVTLAAAFATRSDVGQVFFDGRVYITGGEHSITNYTVFGDTWAASAPFADWQLVAAASPWGNRAYHATDVRPSPAPSGTWILSGGGHCVANFTGDDCTRYLWFGDVWATVDGVHWNCMASSGSSNATAADRFLHRAGPSAMRHHDALLRPESPGDPFDHNGNASSVCSAPQLNISSSNPVNAGAVMWCPRGGHSLNVLPAHGGAPAAVVLAGGMTNAVQLADVWRSQDGGATWQLVAAPAPWTPRSYHATAVFNGSIYLSGGGGFHSLYSDVWTTPDAGSTWIQLSTAAQWAPRFAHTMNVLGNRLVITGGFVAVLLSGTADVWESTDGMLWDPATTNTGWPLRSFHEAVVVPLSIADDKSAPHAELVVVGGWRLNFTAGQPDGYSYTYYNDVWQTEESPACDSDVSAL